MCPFCVLPPVHHSASFRNEAVMAGALTAILDLGDGVGYKE